MTPRVLLVAGARPNFMKVAPVLSALRGESSLAAEWVHTGQHYDAEMSRQFLDELGIPPPAADLDVGSATHAVQTARILERFERVLLDRRPSLVVVVGDVNSTLACSLAAAKLGIAVAHVEAGLRSFDRTMPEEINRVVTDALADLLFVTEPSAVDNLLREGKERSRIHFVGNVMIDTLLRYRREAEKSGILRSLEVEPGTYAVLTLHRPSNVDNPSILAGLLEPIVSLAGRLPVIFPVHPRSRDAVLRALGGAPPATGLRLAPPLGYLDFLRLVSDARLVLTDSGGVQEETTVLGVPCVTLRENTERPITITHGTNRIGGTTPHRIREAIESALEGPRGKKQAPPLWDGAAAQRICAVLGEWLAR